MPGRHARRREGQRRRPAEASYASVKQISSGAVDIDSQMARLYLASTTRYRQIDGLVVVLDLRTGEYLTLNPVASAMWQALLSEADPIAVARRLLEPCDQPAARVEADLRVFRESCLSRGLLQAIPAPARRTPTCDSVRRPLAVLAWISLVSTTRSLSRLGFPRTYARYASIPRPSSGARRAPSVAAAERAFARAELAFVIRSAPNDCLPRSLALWRFLVSTGVCAEHYIGVNRFPFGAHAWTEVDGRVLFDSSARVARYIAIARL